MIHPVFGYMNPGTGSLVLQLLLMGAAGFFLFFKSFWHSIRSLWTRKK